MELELSDLEVIGDSRTSYLLDDAAAKICKLRSQVLGHSPEFAEFLNFYKGIRVNALTQDEIYAQVCWVVYSTGFRYKVVRKYWPAIGRALCYFDVTRVAELAKNLECAALKICEQSNFNNLRKAKWCVVNARRMQELSQDGRFPDGLKSLLVQLSEKRSFEIIELTPKMITQLRLLGIGPTTIFHLLKNVGIDVFKPDRHLRRLLSAFRLVSPDATVAQICEAMEELSVITGMSINEIDSTLFFYGQSRGDVVA